MTTRPFAYNPSTPISGTTQYGDLAVGEHTSNFTDDYGGVKWWMGPDEDLQYIIAETVPSNTQPTENPGEFASVGFYGCKSLVEQDFLNLCNVIPPRRNQTPFNTASEAYTWLTNNGYWTNYNYVAPTPTPTPTPSSTPTITPTPTPTPSVMVQYYILIEDGTVLTAENGDGIEFQY